VTAIVLATSSLAIVMGRLVLTWRDNARLLRASQNEAMADALTGLGNRRALLADLERRLSTPCEDRPFTLVLFDLDGFKQYNDSFGHPSGDALLRRLGAKLERHLAAAGSVDRIGGDEFCALIDTPPDDSGSHVAAAARALSEHGDGFAIGCSHGSVLLPSEAQDVSSALSIADQRMYRHKRAGRVSAAQQSRDVLLSALAERNPALDAHGHDVAELAGAVAATFALTTEQIEMIRQAAELHDIGKVAVPDAILHKPVPLDPAEWAFIRRHTLIGEKIVAAAPDLARVARLVRSSHENYDGTGYPDALKGREIPLGSRIIAVCDAYDAMPRWPVVVSGLSRGCFCPRAAFRAALANKRRWVLRSEGDGTGARHRTSVSAGSGDRPASGTKKGLRLRPRTGRLRSSYERWGTFKPREGGFACISTCSLGGRA
jgi:diguanylate cyclase (GGDEF)-like protein